jgi:hypothetical protein
LARKGTVIARRTIAKYREEIGILPSRLRRERVAVAVPDVETAAALPTLAETVAARVHSR